MVMKIQKIIPVILSGGSGSRLWPLSRSLYPKQLQPIVSEKSLLQETALRLSDEIFRSPLIICNQEHRFIVAEQLREIEIRPDAIVLEPVSRNTAPAAAVAALLSEESEDSDLLLILPSDHAITDIGNFCEAANTARQAASAGKLVAFGTLVDRPEIGYGYMKQGKELTEAPGCYKVSKFVEKPDVLSADKYYNSGEYLWNTGIFMFSREAYLDELNKFHPELVIKSRIAVRERKSDLYFVRLDQVAFEKIKSISIDYAIMEQTDRAAVVPTDMGWSDVGAWDTLWELSPKDHEGNVKLGNVITKKTTNSYLRSEKQLIAALGLKDTIIVSTEDAVLVAGKDHAQEVKEMVEMLKKKISKLHISHARTYRPWGWFDSIEKGDNFQVKRLHVNPGAKLSLQKHSKRAEHWVVVKGTATATNGQKVLTLKKGDSTYIPVGVRHMLENKTDTTLEIIEVQSGSYLGEDDIIRFEDIYSRI